MRNTKTKIKETIAKIYTAFICFMLFTLPAYADDKDKITGAAGFEQVRGYIAGALGVVGGGLLLFGIVQVGLSFQSENSEQKTKGIQCIVGGAIVGGAAALVPVLLGSGAGAGA